MAVSVIPRCSQMGCACRPHHQRTALRRCHNRALLRSGEPSLTNLFSQISPGHLAHPRCITKKSNTVFLGARTPW